MLVVAAKVFMQVVLLEVFMLVVVASLLTGGGSKIL